MSNGSPPLTMFSTIQFCELGTENEDSVSGIHIYSRGCIKLSRIMGILDSFLGRLAKWRISAACMEIFDGLSGGVPMFESYFERFDPESPIKKLARKTKNYSQG